MDVYDSLESQNRFLGGVTLQKVSYSRGDQGARGEVHHLLVVVVVVVGGGGGGGNNNDNENNNQGVVVCCCSCFFCLLLLMYCVCQILILIDHDTVCLSSFHRRCVFEKTELLVFLVNL